MSTYEALIDLHRRIEINFQRMKTEAEDLDSSIGIFLKLHDRGLADLGLANYQRLSIGRSRLGTGCDIAAESIQDASKILRELERARILRDLAFDLGDSVTASQLELVIVEKLDVAEGELREAHALQEMIQVALKELQPPRLVPSRAK